MDLSIHGPGAVVRPGVKILDIVPQDEKLVVEVRLAPQDIDQIQIGQSAEVRFGSIRQRELSRIDGQLISVSADRFTDEKTQQAYFLGRVEILPSGLETLKAAKLTLHPGMPMEVLINTGERTMLTYLTAPLFQAFARSLRER
jgi:epimerase transport system membrane fusion protein